jgi:hypothetical protein
MESYLGSFSAERAVGYKTHLFFRFVLGGRGLE